MEIHVLMATDENYISQARVAIWTMRKSTDRNTKLIITILCSNRLDHSSKDRLYALERKFHNLYIEFYEVNEFDFNQAHGRGHLPVAAYYRLVAAEILKIDKCIYLDCDLVVNLDLDELYRIDISDCYFGGVVDMNLISRPDMAYLYMGDCNLNDFSDYINTGVLLMNLELIRREHMVDKFLEEMIGSNNRWLDQDVINRVCHGKIRLIDWTFNHIAGYSSEEYVWQCGETKRPGCGEIYHWASRAKAWNNSLYYQAKLWWDAAKEALEPEVYQEYYSNVNNYTKRFYFHEIAEKCQERMKIVIFGYSDIGMQVMRYLRRYGIKGRILFCDNNAVKRKMHFIGCDVMSVEDAAMQYKDAMWINVVQNARAEADEQMKKLGIPENQILEYYRIDCDSYLFLEETYMKKGIEEKLYLARKA